jgi:transcriptional regulator with XRE-family HTH domain
MTRTTSPTVSRRWIALEMKRLRQQAGLSQATVAKALGCQVPKVSLMENGQRPVHDDDLRKLLVEFDVPTEDRQLYLDEAKNAQEKGWWEHYDDHTVPPWFGDFVGLEQGAERIRAYQPAIVHGLVQTPEYTAAIYRGLTARRSEEVIRDLVQVRLRRQEMFLHPSDAPSLWVVLDEAAVRHVVGSPKVMQAQLERIVDLCQTRDNLTVQVVPFDRGGSYEAAYGSFTILSFPFRTDAGVVYMEHHLGGTCRETLSEVDKYSELFRQLSELALSPEDSLSMLGESAEAYSRVE